MAGTSSSITPDGDAPSTPATTHELKNYNPFSAPRLFRSALSIRRDSFVQEDQAIAVFTSGGDSSGSATGNAEILIYTFKFGSSIFVLLLNH